MGFSTATVLAGAMIALFTTTGYADGENVMLYKREAECINQNQDKYAQNPRAAIVLIPASSCDKADRDMLAIFALNSEHVGGTVRRYLLTKKNLHCLLDGIDIALSSRTLSNTSLSEVSMDCG